MTSLKDEIREAILQELEDAVDRVMDRITECSICHQMYLAAIITGRHTNNYCCDCKIEGDRGRKRRWARRKAEKRKANAS